MAFAFEPCAVQPDWLSRRVTLMEQRVDGLETQITDLRGDMNARFTSLHAEMNERFTSLHGEMNERFTSLHGEMHERFGTMQAQMDSRFDAVEQVLISLHAQFTDLQRHMLVLHEDVIDRISRIKG